MNYSSACVSKESSCGFSSGGLCINAVTNRSFQEFGTCAPWNIYLQNWAIFGVTVGKYSSTMEHLGFVHVIVFFIIYFRTGSNVP
jgi:hypothetical protein